MVGVIVGVKVGVGILEVGLLVKVGGNDVADGSGVNVWVGARNGVWDATMEAVGVQVGGSPAGLRLVGSDTLLVC